MSRHYLLSMGALALLLMFGAWWFTTASAATGQVQFLAPAGVPVGLMVIGGILSWIGLRKGFSGLFVSAATLTGIGSLSLLCWFFPVTSAWMTWVLLPAITGAAILVENRMGFGWRFTNRQGIGLLLTSLGLILMATILSILPSISSSASMRIPFVTEMNAPGASSVNLGQINLLFLFQLFIWR